MPSRKSLESLLASPNVQKFLNLISQTEGTDKNGYATAFGGGQLPSLNDHPRQLHSFKQTDGKSNKTSAAGRYQFLTKTWDGLKKQYDLKDFGARSQDIAALGLIAGAGALDHVLKGDFTNAIKKTGGIWASLPSSPYAQPKKSWNQVDKMLGGSGGGGGGGTMTAKGNVASELDALFGINPNSKQTKAPQAAKPTRQPANSSVASELDALFGIAAPQKRNFTPMDINAEARRTLDQKLKEAGKTTGLQSALIGTAETFGAGAMQGLTYASDGFNGLVNKVLGTNLDTQNYDRFTNKFEGARKTLDQQREANGQTGIDGWRLTGNIASTLPAALATGGASTLGQAALIGGGTGLGIGAASFAKDAGQRGTNAVLGGIGGAVGGAVGQKVGQGVAKAARAISARTAASSSSSTFNQQVNTQINVALARQGQSFRLDDLEPSVQRELQKAVGDAIKGGKNLDSAAIERAAVFANLKSKGIDLEPTLKQTTGNPKIWTEETELSKLTGAKRLNERYVKQQQTLGGALNAADDRLGASSENERQIMEMVYGGLAKQDQARSNYISALYDHARNHTGNDLTLNAGRFATNVKFALDEGGFLGDKVPSSIFRHIDELQQGKHGPFTLAQKERLVKQLNSRIGATNDRTEKVALNTIRKTLEQETDDSLNAFGTQLQGQAKASWDDARKAAAGRFKLIDDTPILKQAIDDAEPDKAFERLVWDGNYRELKSAVDTIRSGSPEGIAELKHGIMQRIIKAGTSEVNDGISPKGLFNAMNDIGNDKLRLVFSPAEVTHLEQLKQAAKFLISHPTGSNVNHSNTASAMLNANGGALMKALFGLNKFPWAGEKLAALPNYALTFTKTRASAAKSVNTTATPKPATAGEKKQVEKAVRYGIGMGIQGRDD